MAVFSDKYALWDAPDDNDNMSKGLLKQLLNEDTAAHAPSLSTGVRSKRQPKNLFDSPSDGEDSDNKMSCGVDYEAMYYSELAQRKQLELEIEILRAEIENLHEIHSIPTSKISGNETDRSEAHQIANTQEDRERRQKARSLNARKKRTMAQKQQSMACREGVGKDSYLFSEDKEEADVAAGNRDNISDDADANLAMGSADKRIGTDTGKGTARFKAVSLWDDESDEEEAKEAEEAIGKKDDKEEKEWLEELDVLEGKADNTRERNIHAEEMSNNNNTSTYHNSSMGNNNWSQLPTEDQKRLVQTRRQHQQQQQQHRRTRPLQSLTGNAVVVPVAAITTTTTTTTTTNATRSTTATPAPTAHVQDTNTYITTSSSITSSINSSSSGNRKNANRNRASVRLRRNPKPGNGNSSLLGSYASTTTTTTTTTAAADNTGNTGGNDDDDDDDDGWDDDDDEIKKDDTRNAFDHENSIAEGTVDDDGWDDDDEINATKDTQTLQADTTTNNNCSSNNNNNNNNDISSSSSSSSSNYNGIDCDNSATSTSSCSPDIDATLRQWASGRSLVQLLQTVCTAAVHSLPELIKLGLVPQMVAQLSDDPATVRKTYLRIARICHPDKLIHLQPDSIARQEAIKIFTILADAYGAFKTQQQF